MKTKKKRNARAPPSLSDLDDQSPTITKEVEDAMKEHESGNYTKALNLVEATLSRHPSSSLALAALSFCHLKFVFSAKHSTTPVSSDEGLFQLAETFNHVKEAVDLSKRAVHLCPNSLSCWFFHVNALFKLTEYDANAGHGPVIEACDAGLAIEFAPEDLATEHHEQKQQTLMVSDITTQVVPDINHTTHSSPSVVDHPDEEKLEEKKFQLEEADELDLHRLLNDFDGGAEKEYHSFEHVEPPPGLRFSPADFDQVMHYLIRNDVAEA
nr:hypothetical protein CFP56_58501 [Quercus suber]